MKNKPKRNKTMDIDYEKKYKEALGIAMLWNKNTSVPKECKKIFERMFPELKKDGDEEIKNWLIGIVEEVRKANPTNADHNGKCSDAIAWIEKRREQDSNEDSNILQRFSFYSYKDEPNILYLSGLYVNEKYRNKGIGTKILEVTDEVAKSLNCHVIRLKTKKDSNAERLYRAHGYNSLVTEEKDEIWLEKQGIYQTPDEVIEECHQDNADHIIDIVTEQGKPTNEEMKELLRTEYEKGRADVIAEMQLIWSEDDEKNRIDAIKYLELFDAQGIHGNVAVPCINWLKALKDRVQPKPKREWSEEDKEIIEALDFYVKNLDIFFSEIKINDKNISSKEFRENVQHWLKGLKNKNK